MGFFREILDKAKDILGIKNKQKLETNEKKCLERDEYKPVDVNLPSMVNLADHNCQGIDNNDTNKIIDDFVIKHPAACEIFEKDLEKIKNNPKDLDLLVDYLDTCNFKIDLYSGCIRDIFVITHTRSRIAVKLRPEIVFEVQGTVKENIDLFKDLIPYVIKLFIYDCKKLVFNIFEFFHINKKELNVSVKSIADDFVNKIALGITLRIREMLAANFTITEASIEHIYCKELVDIVNIAEKYNRISRENSNICFSLDEVLGKRYQENLSTQIDKVIARYENRHIVDKIKDYLLILFYVLRFFYSIFFGAGFLYLIWLSKNLDKWGKNIDTFFIKTGELFTPEGAEYASKFISPMLASAFSKITISLFVLGGMAVVVYFAYQVYAVRRKLSDIVNLNISIYAASLLDISIYQSTDKLIYDISKVVQTTLDIPRNRLLANRTSENRKVNEERIDDKEVSVYIERVVELRALCERLIACAKKKNRI